MTLSPQSSSSQLHQVCLLGHFYGNPCSTYEGLALKILILGTSNSILVHGWVAGLRRALPEADITNLSVGASPGTQFGLNMAADITGYDAVFFDSVVNDENFAPLLGTPQFAERIIFELISTIAAQAPAIVLGFSNARHLHAHSALYTRRRELSAICGAQFVGMHEMVEKFGSARIDGDLFDASGAHPINELQNQFGYELGRLLPQADRLLRRVPHAQDFACNFTTIQAVDFAGQGRMFTKSNRLTSCDMLEIQPGTQLAFDAPGLCIGIYINSMETKALATLQGPDASLLKDFWFETGNEKLMLKFVPLHNGFPLRTLTVLPAAEFPANAATVNRTWGSQIRWNAPRENMKMRFVNALFWSGQASAPVPTQQTECLQLQHMLEEALGSAKCGVRA